MSRRPRNTNTTMLESQALHAGLHPYPACCLRRQLSKHEGTEVWEAENENGPLAIKFSPCSGDQPIQRELEFLLDFSRVSHPHLISIQLVWCYRNYIVVGMELAFGSILDLLKVSQNKFGARQVCGYLSQAAEALDFLNTCKNLISGQRVTLRHGNIKPANLLLIGDKVKLTDLKQPSQTTSDGSGQRLADTLRYAAPEVFQSRLSHRADQYALAVTYCHLRGGRLSPGRRCAG